MTLLLSGSPTSTNFGNIVLGDRGGVVVTLTNVGTDSVAISQANVMGREFSMSGLSVPLTLAPGQSTGFSLTFLPNASGPVNGNVSNRKQCYELADHRLVFRHWNSRCGLILASEQLDGGRIQCLPGKRNRAAPTHG